MKTEYKVIVISDALSRKDYSSIGDMRAEVLSEIFNELAADDWTLGSVTESTATFWREKRDDLPEGVTEVNVSVEYLERYKLMKNLLGECLEHLEELKAEWSWKEGERAGVSYEEYDALIRTTVRVREAIKHLAEAGDDTDDDDVAANG